MDRRQTNYRNEKGTANARGISLLLLASLASGCAPNVNVLGVYFPPWLVSAVAGLSVAYCAIWFLGRRPGTRELAQSGLLFCSLIVIVSLLLWWLLFSAF